MGEVVFRSFFAFILLTAFGMSGYFRRRARRSETIARRREGGWMLVMRLAVALPFFAGMAAYLVDPRWMAWSTIPLPGWLRWAGVAVGLAMLPMLYWVFSSIGRNISETVLTKSEHELVTHGPYRWVRHPLYTLATAAFLSLGVIAANAFIIGMAVVMFAAVALLVVPKEEAKLTDKFGLACGEYRRTTGALAPRILPRG